MATKKVATTKKAASKGLTKAVLVELIASEFEFSKSRAGDILDFVTETLKKSIKKSGSVSLSGLGTFRIAKRAARTGRNPATGETIRVKASKTVRFKPTPTFKSEL